MSENGNGAKENGKGSAGSPMLLRLVTIPWRGILAGFALIGWVFRMVGWAFKGIGWVVHHTVGSWNSPPWLKYLLRFPVRGFRALLRAGAGIHAGYPLAFRAGVVLAVSVGVAFAGFQGWRMTRPKPPRYSVQVGAPEATPLKKDARPDPLMVAFGGSVARLEQIGKPVEKGVSLTPPFPGQWRWRDEKTLVFVPSGDWRVDTQYSVILAPWLFPDHVLLERYALRFRTAPFSARVVSSEFYQNPADPREKRVVATIRFSHPVDIEDFPGRVKLLLGKEKKEIPFELSYDEFDGRAFIRSEPLLLPPKNTDLSISIDDGTRPAGGGNSLPDDLLAKVRIPGLFGLLRMKNAEFTLVRNDRNELEQVLILESSTGIGIQALAEKLEAYVLPVDRPPRAGLRGAKRHRWRNVREIGEDTLRASRKLNLAALPSAQPYPTQHSFRFQAGERRYVYLRVRKELRAESGYVMAKTYDKILRVPRYPQEARFLAEGSVLSLGGEKKLTIAASNLKAVRIEVGQVLLGNLHHLVTQAGGDLSNPEFLNYTFDEENIVESKTLLKNLAAVAPGKPQYTSIDLSPYLSANPANKRGFFLLKARGWDPVRKIGVGKEDRRLILVTDLGVLVKKAKDGSRDVFVVSIGRGRPAGGAKVLALGKNGLVLLSTETDARGRARLPNLADFQRERKPTVILVRQGRDLSFLPFERFQRQLEFSRFDIGGEESPVTRRGEDTRLRGLDAYLFSNRGIYRPGDRLHVGAIVRAGNWARDLTGVPLEAVFRDARGLEVAKYALRLSREGFEEVSYITEATSPTGTWRAALYVVKDGKRRGLLGSTNMRVEEFLPDRMRIVVRLDKTRLKGWVSPEGLHGLVTLKNLFGTPAAGRRISARITLQPRPPVFREWPAFRFADPLAAKKRFKQQLPDAETDAEGKASLPIDLSRFAPATYRLDLIASGFEAQGGRAVLGEVGVLVSPLAYLVGYKPDGGLSYIRQDTRRGVELIAVGPELERKTVSGLSLELVEKRQLSVLTRQDDGTFKYQSVVKEKKIRARPLNLPAAGAREMLDTAQPGDFVLIVRDGKGAELNRIEYTVAGKGDLTRSLDKNAELEIRLDKKDYAPGERIELQIRAPYTGTGLITIEREKVYAAKWFRTDTTSTLQTIRVPKELEGNGYVNVAFVRSLSSREIFMSPLSYGVKPFTVDKEQRLNPVVLSLPDRTKPGEPFTIGYSSRQPGRIAVIAVDEGILQVAGYATPDPLAYFFRKRALEVKTSQILDLILPEFSLVRALAAPGGGLPMEAAKRASRSRMLNPFQRRTLAPVAFWSGLLPTGGTPREVTFRVPDHFNGTLRVMAVAVSPQTIGVARSSVLVRGPFVISPNAPTFLAPGDEAVVSVSVANTLEGSGKGLPVKLTLRPSKNLIAVDGTQRDLVIDEGAEGTAAFRIRATDGLGAASLAFLAASGERTVRFTLGVSVRPATPFQVTSQGGFVSEGRAEVPIRRKLFPHLRTLEASASTLPLGVAHGLTRYLEAFPYGCTEQVVSKAFPALVLQSRPEFATAPKLAARRLGTALRVLQSRQNGEGAFGFWAANSHVSDFQSVYALHFLTELAERQDAVPARLLRRGMRYLSKLGKSPAENLGEARSRAYALYVLTRNGVVTSRQAKALRDTLKRRIKGKWKEDLSAVLLAATFQLLHEEREAEKLIAPLRLGQDTPPDYNLFYDGLFRDAMLLYVLALHFPDRLARLEGEELQRLVEPVLQGGYNTISSAMTILALDAYATARPHPPPGGFSVAEVLEESQARELQLPEGLFPRVAFSPEATKIRFTQAGRTAIFYQTLESGFDRLPPEKPVTEQLEIQREYRDGEGKVVTRVSLGDRVQVHLKIRSLGGRYLANIAIQDLLPGGFEVELDTLPRGSIAGARGRRGGSRRGAPAGGGAWKPEFVEAREDRVLVFGTATPAVGEFVYTIRATNTGTFAVPPVYADSMYDRSVKARALGGSITVEPAQ